MQAAHAAAPDAVPEDRLSALLSAAVDGVVLIDQAGLITRFNRSAERMFGYTGAEVLGRNVSLLMPEPFHSRHDGYLERYKATGERRIIGIGREVVAQRKDGSTFPIELSVGEFLHRGDTPGRRQADTPERGFVGILRDITQRKQQEREANDLRNRLAHVGRIGTLGEMVSGIAHEVNQPLTAIATYADACRRLVEAGQFPPEELAATLKKISDQADRAGQVIRGLRKLVRRGETAAEELDVNALVAEVAGLLAFEFRQAGAQLRFEPAAAAPRALGDPVQVQQVVLNLIHNALEAQGETPAAALVEVTVAPLPGAGQVAIRVADRGPGVAPSVQSRLFEPFVTTKPSGFGLGLSICKSIALAHGGGIDHEPRPGGGAVFTLRLPAQEGPA